MDMVTDMAREWVITAYEGFEGLQLQECDPQEPKATQIRLRIEAFALNWGDNDRVFPIGGHIDAWRYLKGARKTYGKVVVETGAREGNL